MSQQIIIDYWVEKAGEDLASARDNLKSGRYQNAVRDAYFACFHAFSAVLLNEEIMIKVTATKFRNNLTACFAGGDHSMLDYSIKSLWA